VDRAGTGRVRDVAAGARISGSPAFAANEWLRAVTAFSKLPEMVKTLRDLKKKVDQLEQHVKSNGTP
jgi:UDP-3-O-[3-hydroxymyristoyl] glucosamine N-acyltransferase